MKTKMNPAMGGGASASKKLLAAIAVLAVAFVVFAAIPVADIDGDATGTTVAKIGAEEYPTLQAAMEASKSDSSDNVTVEITGVAIWDDDWNYTTKNYTFIGTTKNAEIQSKYSDAAGYHAGYVQVGKTDGTVTFQSLILSKVNGQWIPDAGHMNNYFTVYRGAATVNYINCVFPNGACSSNTTTLYAGCTFESVNGNSALWMYGNTTCTVDHGVFNGKKGIKLYSEGIAGMSTAAASKNVLIVQNSEFKTETPAINLTIAEEITLSNNTYPSSGTIEMKLGSDAKSSGTKVTSNSRLVCKVEEEGKLVDTGIIVDSKLYRDFSEVCTGNILNDNSEIVLIRNTEISGSISNNISIKTDGYGSAEAVVPAGKTLAVSANKSISVDNNATMTVNGKLTGAVSGTGKVVAGPSSDISGATFAAGIETEIDPSAMSEMIVGGDSITGTQAQQTVFGNTQIVTVSKEAGYWNLVNGADITINGKLVVPEGTTLTVQAGAKLTFGTQAVVEIEGTLVIEDGYKNADGTSVDPAKITQKGGKVVVTGTAQIAGQFSATAGQFIAEQDSVVTVEETGKLVSANIVVKDSANFKVKGTITNGSASTIYNYGVVIFDSKVAADADVEVKMMADGATVVINNYTVASKDTKLTITDKDMVVYTDKKNSVEYKVGAAAVDQGTGIKQFKADENTVVIQSSETTAFDKKYATVSGIIVVEKLTSKASDGTSSTAYAYVKVAGKEYDNKMQISGSISTSAVDSTAAGTAYNAMFSVTVTAKHGAVIPAGETGTALAVGINAKLVNDTGSKLTVEGAVDATAKASTSSSPKDADSEFSNSGTVTVVKDGSVKTLKELGATVNATLYETGTDKIKNYVEIDAALAMVNADGNTVKALTVLGKQTVDATATVPADVTVTLKDNNTQLVIGAKAGADVTLTVNKAGSLKGTGKEITVNGTLFAENKLKLTASPIVSDVMSEEIKEGKLVRDGWIKYTNIVAALNGAEDGQTITISKTNEDGKQYVAIASDIAIKAGVTLVVGDDVAPLKLADGVTLTVAGTLQTEQPVYAATMFDLKASSIKDSESSAIVVDGTVKAVAGAFAYGFNAAPTNKSTADRAPIAGAYYTAGDYQVISTLAIAVQNISDIQSEITVNGKVSVGDIAFSGNDDYKTIVIGNSIMSGTPAKVKYETLFQVSSLTLANGAQLAIENVAGNRSIGSFTGTVVVGDAAVDFVGVSAESVADTAATSVPFVGESDGKLVLMNKIDASDKGDKIAVSKGTVYMDGKFAVDSIDTTAKTNGVFSVATGAVLEPVSKTTTGIIDALFVDGTLNVPSGSAVTVGTLTVNGTVVVAVATSTAGPGTLTVNENIYIGLDASDIEKSSTGATASVSGSFGFGTAYVADGAVLDDAAVAALSADGVNKLAFNVQGKLWFTAYSTTGESVTVNKAPLSNAILAGWSKTEGGEAIEYDVPVSDHAAGTVRYEFPVDGEIEALYAVVQTYIYNVTVVAEAGIENIAIDGNLLTNNTATVAAGTHNVTYTLKNGYSGTATMTVNGQKQTGLSFSTSGTSDADRTVSIQLSGITASGYVDPTPVVPEEKDDDGLSLTDILLIILVVLIVIMAIIVAMRLMRS